MPASAARGVASESTPLALAFRSSRFLARSLALAVVDSTAVGTWGKHPMHEHTTTIALTLVVMLKRYVMTLL